MNKIKLKREQAGLTLVELMVALVMSLFLIGGVLVIHLSSRATFLDTGQLSRIQENVRFASDYMIRDIRTAGFRDETFLRLGHELQIRDQYADISADGTVLTVRYAGRGHCTEAFDDFRMIENEYSLDADTGDLMCRGRNVDRDAAGDVLIADATWSDPVALVGGLTGLAFQRICADGGTACVCSLTDASDNDCMGVRVAMQFEGLRAFDGSGDFEDRSVELTAAFRNIVLDRMNTHVFAEE